MRVPVHALLLVGLEASWCTPWLLLFGQWGDRPLLPWYAPAVLIGLGHAAAGVRPGSAGPSRGRRAAAVGLGVVAVAALGLLAHGWPAGLERTPLIELPRLILPPGPGVWGFLAGLLLWRAGLGQGAAANGFDRVETGFTRGLAGLVLFVPVAALTSPSGYPALRVPAVWSVVAFFFLALTALALARLGTVLRGRTGDEAAPSVDRGWLATLIGLIGGLIALTVALSLLLSLDLVALVVGSVVRPVLTALAVVLLTIALPFAYVVALLAELIRGLIDRRQPAGGQPMGGLEGMLDQLRERRPPVEPSPELVLASQWALLLVGGVVLALALARAMRWWRERADDEEEDEARESVWRWDLLRAALRAWLAARLGRARAGAAPPPDERPAPPPARPGASSVRELYRRLLALGAARGRHRRPATTPSEHLAALATALAPEPDLAGLTEAYLAARYGPHEPDPAAVAAATAAWERVNTLSTNER